MQLVSRIGQEVVVEVAVVVAKMNFRILVPNVHESVNGQVWLEPTCYLCVHLVDRKILYKIIPGVGVVLGAGSIHCAVH